MSCTQFAYSSLTFRFPPRQNDTTAATDVFLLNISHGVTDTVPHCTTPDRDKNLCVCVKLTFRKVNSGMYESMKVIQIKL